MQLCSALVLGGIILAKASDDAQLGLIDYYNQSTRIVLIEARVDSDAEPLEVATIQTDREKRILAKVNLVDVNLLYSSYTVSEDEYADASLRVAHFDKAYPILVDVLPVGREGSLLPIISHQLGEDAYFVITYDILLSDASCSLRLLAEPSLRQVEAFLTQFEKNAEKRIR